MELKLEVIVVPVSDLDRAKQFYTEQAGFTLDHDTKVSDTFRVMQLTPPGSACSIVIQSHMPGTDAPPQPGSVKGLQLVTPDLRATRAELAGRGLDITEVRVIDEGTFREARDDDTLDYVGFAFFRDPDGNSWAIQQLSRK
jgi:catechol 2,3-dioxygenase-like lactoylglutathione lyase family enzyme